MSFGLRFAVVGPGRLGTVLARGLMRAGMQCDGFVGRSGGTASEAATESVLGRPLSLAELGEAAVVLIAVPDDVLPSWVEEAVSSARARACSLWLHTSGVHPASVLDPLRDALSCRVGAFHPLVPIASRTVDPASLSGVAVGIEVEASASSLAERLAGELGMLPFEIESGADRSLYHAACNLAANGTTALLDCAARLLMRAVPGMESEAARAAVSGLSGAASTRCRSDGPANALSGPVRRGDAATMRQHVASLADDADALAVYVALMRVASELAVSAGLPAQIRDDLLAVLAGQEPSRSSDRPNTEGTGG